jgi:glycine reductase
LKLELGFIQIKDIQFSNECAVKDGVLYVNADDVKAFVYDNDDVKSYIESIELDIAKPGESVRITPLRTLSSPVLRLRAPAVCSPVLSPRLILSVPARPTS